MGRARRVRAYRRGADAAGGGGAPEASGGEEHARAARLGASVPDLRARGAGLPGASRLFGGGQRRACTDRRRAEEARGHQEPKARRAQENGGSGEVLDGAGEEENFYLTAPSFLFRNFTYCAARFS